MNREINKLLRANRFDQVEKIMFARRDKVLNKNNDSHGR